MRSKAHLTRQLLVGEELANLVVGLDVGNRIASRRLANAFLIDKGHSFHAVKVALQCEMFSGTFFGFVEIAFHGPIKNRIDQRTLAGTAHAGYNGHHVERKVHIDAFEVVGTRSPYGDGPIPTSATGGYGYGFFAQEVTHGVALRTFLQVTHISLINDLSAQASGIGTNVDDVIGGPDDLLVVLNDYYRVAQLLQTAQDMNQTVGVATMQTHAGFIQDVE